jgi:hypothetical protein
MGISQQIGASSLIKPGVIDNAAARPASPFEGQMVYEKDTDMIAIYNGTAWRYIAAATPTNGTVLQVERDTDTTTRNTTSSSFTDVTGVSVTITPKSITSKILVIASFLALAQNSTSGSCRSSYQITTSGNTALSGAELQIVGTVNYTQSGGYIFQPVTMIGFISPASVAAQTYKLRFRAEDANVTAYVASGDSTTQLFAIELAG